MILVSFIFINITKVWKMNKNIYWSNMQFHGLYHFILSIRQILAWRVRLFLVLNLLHEQDGAILQISARGLSQIHCMLKIEYIFGSIINVKYLLLTVDDVQPQMPGLVATENEDALWRLGDRGTEKGRFCNARVAEFYLHSTQRQLRYELLE